MNSKERKNFNEFYLDMTNLIEKHIERVPPHEVGHSLIAAVTAMMLENTSNHVGVLKLCNAAVNSGIDDWLEESCEHDKPDIFDKE